MSTCTQQTMINHHGYDHGSGRFAQLRQTVHAWRERVRQRRELAQWSARDLHDVGLSWNDIAREVEKPFWRA